MKEQLLCPGIVSTRRRPVNLQPGDLELFEHEFQKKIPPSKLLELKNVRISGDGFLFKGLDLLPISFAFPHLLDEWRLRSRIKFLLNNYLNKRQRSFQERALWLVDDWSYGYFHWLADAVTRLYIMRARLDEYVLLLPHRYRELEFVEGSLNAFGLTNFEFIEPDETLLVESLTVPMPTAPSGHYREEIIRGVRELLLKEYGSRPGRTGTRLYISRSAARKRRIQNEDELCCVLIEFGFDVLRAEELSFADQVRITSDAEFMISNHGAGLTNMLFMRGGGSVLELRHKSDSVNNCYFTLSSALELNYFYQTCEADSEDAHTAD
ncbi:MAG TPA: glycosyltransferase family 61 protein, partial [Pyrinomonadaceae bacterium]|nr:glycosyltransferase family 61 protein [Pyrinomonadaceae bacterium]